MAWLVTHTPKSTVSELLRIAWRSVGAIIERVVADGRAAHDPFEGLTRIGLDEISYKRGHRYLTICVDHASGRLICAAVGRDKRTLNGFFDLLGSERCAQIRLVSADAAEWIADVVAERCPNATICIDAFHVVAWATKALDDVRREVWNEARKGGMTQHARELKGCRYALWRNPEDLTPRQANKLAWIAKVNTELYRAYLMKEQLRIAIRTKGVLALTMLDEWLAWAQRCRIPAFVASVSERWTTASSAMRRAHQPTRRPGSNHDQHSLSHPDQGLPRLRHSDPGPMSHRSRLWHSQVIL